MPIRSRGTFLAWTAALLGLCGTGAGCQTGPRSSMDAFAPRCGAQCNRSLVSLGTPVVAKDGPAKRGLFDRVRAVVHQGTAPASAGSQAGTVLRPVPIGTTMPAAGGAPAGTVASAWQPAHGSGAELDRPIAGELTRVSAIAEPMPLVPLAIATTGGQEPDKGMDKDKGGKGKDAEQLPPPRPEGAVRGGIGAQSLPVGLPPGVTLPHPLIPHPPEAPREGAKSALVSYIVEPPDILIVQGTSAIQLPNLELNGAHLVRPDGKIGLGAYGEVYVAGLSIEQVRVAVAQHLAQLRRTYGGNPKNKLTELTAEQIILELKVDVAAYNSKFYYVITDGAGYGEQVYRFPFTGNETVLDALAQIQGIPAVGSRRKIWVARATPHHHAPMILAVDWCGIAQGGAMGTNYQIFPGDRLYIKADHLFVVDGFLGKVLAPVERLLGITLLGNSVVNGIRTNGRVGANGGALGN